MLTEITARRVVLEPRLKQKNEMSIDMLQEWLQFLNTVTANQNKFVRSIAELIFSCFIA